MTGILKIFLLGNINIFFNNAEKVSTLNKLNINYPNERFHNIKSNLVITGGDIGCLECVPTEKALMGSLITVLPNGNSMKLKL